MNLKGFKIRLKDVPEVVTHDQVILKMPVHPEVTGPPIEAPISLFIIVYPPNVSSPLHSHASDEYEYIISGTGLLQSGEVEGIPLEPDTIVYNPKGTAHKITNTGEEPLKVLKVHVPPIAPFAPDDVLIEKAIIKAKKAFRV